MEIENLYKERQILREELSKINRCHLEDTNHKYSEDDKKIEQNLREIHKKILEIELNNPNLQKTRDIYSVCGWSDRHNYFRFKKLQTKNLEEALEKLEVLKKDEKWRIPTIIVKETFFRKNCGYDIDFDSDYDGCYHRLGFSDTQEVIAKSMCNVRGLRWKDLLPANEDRFTY